MPTPEQLQSSRSYLRRLLRPTIIIAGVFGVTMFCSLGVWASLAPLASAAIASGTVSPDTSRKTIQHLEGGILREIKVVEGSRVTKGQVLFTLEPIAARAQYLSRRQQWMRLQVARARLEAHWKDQDAFEPPSFPDHADDPGLQAFIATQVALFTARRMSFIESDGILKQQIEQLNQQLIAKTRENESLAKQREFLEEEIEDKKELIRKSLARKPEWLALERARADNLGRTQANLATMAAIVERKGEVELSIVTNRTQLNQEISDQLVRTNTDISQLEETLPASEDILKRTDIVAPVDGVVLNIRFKTVGGVVRPGEALVDVVPANDDLYIDAKLSPNDIDVVRVGQQAEVYLTPYVSRHAPRLIGELTRVGADIVREPPSPGAPQGAGYFEIRVRIDKSQLARTDSMVMTPGMPAEVYILTGTRTFTQYFLDPIVKSFRRAFRED
jgi:HlyD family type I secretion membrane fusion protein